MTASNPLLHVAANVTRFYLPYELVRYFATASVVAALVWLLKPTSLRSRTLQLRQASRSTASF